MANGNIIEAAKAAYTPAKVDISGFVNGLSAIATGIIAKKKKNAAKRSKADSVVFNTKDNNSSLSKICDSMLFSLSL